MWSGSRNSMTSLKTNQTQISTICYKNQNNSKVKKLDSADNKWTVFMMDTTTVNRSDKGHRWRWGDLQQAGPTGVHKRQGQRAMPPAHMTSRGKKHSGMCPGYQAHSQKCPAGSQCEWVTEKKGERQWKVGRLWVFDMTCRNEYEQNGETKLNIILVRNIF